MSHVPVLILPGLLEDADAFEALIGGMSDIATTMVADMTRAETIAALARGALEQAPAEPFVLAGHSMGGYVALEIMRVAPRRVSKLVLLNTHARPDSAESTENRRRLMALADTEFEAVVNVLLPKLMTPHHLEDPVLTGIVGAMALGTGKEAFQRQERAIIGRIDSRPHLAAIACPTLVIAGRDDVLMPVELPRELADGIAGARLEVIDDCGHMASLEQPGEVLRIVSEFVAA